MARADSTIRVNIVGDTKSLQAATDKAESAVSGLGKLAGGLALGAGFAIGAEKALEFGQTALGEADRIGDATARLEAQLGKLAAPLEASATQFERLGQSRQDVLELEARVADFGASVGLAADKTAPLATNVAEAASALALIGVGGGDAATIVDLIGKAAKGGEKPLAELGISLSDAEVATRAMKDTGKDLPAQLTDTELAAARFSLILEKLKPRIDDITGGEADLEQKQLELQAKFETFTGRVGEALEGPLTDLLTFLTDATGSTEDMKKALNDLLNAFTRLLGPLGAAIDGLRTFIDLASRVTGIHLPTVRDPNASSSRTSGHPGPVTINVQGGTREDTQTAVQEAIARLERIGSL